jgi:hypothetical protein
LPRSTPLPRAAAPRSVLRTAAILLACLAASAVAPAAGDEGRERPRSGGRLIWVGSEQLDLLGDLWTELPFALGGAEGFRFSVDTRLAIEKSRSDFAFQVRDLQYAIEVGRGFRSSRGGLEIFPFAGQQGKEAVDADGRAWVRYAGVAFASADFRSFDSPGGVRVRWRLAAGPTLGDHEVRADAVVRGQGRLLLGRRFEVEVGVDALVDGWHLDAEVAGGPRFSLPAGQDRRASLFLHYLRGSNPLLLQDDFWMLGFAYEEGESTLPWTGEPPEIDGTLTAGGGDGRAFGRLLLRMLSPSFAGGTRAVFQVDANVLTADDTDELYYNYHAGIEHPLGGWFGGAYFFHRSNHQLSEVGDRITALNVVEIGLESPGWTRPGARAGKGWALFEAFARVGYLVDSSFGEDPLWHARGGFRWSAPVRAGRPQPFVLADGEAGDVARATYALGLALSRASEVRVEYLRDDQYFGQDRTAVLLNGIVGF